MKGILYVISGPSGAGKSTILKKAMEHVDGFQFSVSYTTRKIRKGEEEGVDYFFISEEKFFEMKKNEDFLESALVHGNYYGTSKSYVEKILSKGKNVVLDVDIQGALNIKKALNENTVLMYVAPPSYEVLCSRLENRGTESQKDLKKRLEDAKWELSKIHDFDYLIVNSVIDESVRKMVSVIISEQIRVNRLQEYLEKYTF